MHPSSGGDFDTNSGRKHVQPAENRSESRCGWGLQGVRRVSGKGKAPVAAPGMPVTVSSATCMLLVQGAQANLNDIGGHKSHEVPASGPPHASAAGQPGPPPQSYTAAAPPKQPATSSLDKVKEGLSKVSRTSAIG